MSTFRFLESGNNEESFNAVRISIAGPEEVHAISKGQVTRQDTLNYRTGRPEKSGLFCAQIFGPIKDYECICSKYKGIKYKGIVCEKCGVEVISSKVRHERMGHIDLVSPVVHPWFLRSLPSRISGLLDIQLKDLERTIYFESYIVTNPKTTPLKYGQLLKESEYHDLVQEYGIASFDAGIGSEAIRTMLAELDLQFHKRILSEALEGATSELKRKRIVKRLRLIESFIVSGNKPENMVITVLPVLPPDLRPLVMLEGGRFATSDLNELYRCIINRNNRLKRLLELSAPEIITRNEKRMLLEAVFALLDGKKAPSSNIKGSRKVLKSLSDHIKGKQGRFRCNLLGKRVDYSGRSVIIVGPELHLNQCGLPKIIALELFKPFLYAKLQELGVATNLRAAKKLVDKERPEVWDALELVVYEHPVLLNRAPTLHRLGIQAFEPVLIDGKAIQLHPLVCSAFNADFDGDQMGVHVPLSVEAQLEARILMLSTNNILSPANGKPVITPRLDIILGLYYLTLDNNSKETSRTFSSIAEVEHALFAKVVTVHSKVKFQYTVYNHDSDTTTERIANTTVGRIIMFETLPHHDTLSFENVNKVFDQKEVSILLETIYRNCGSAATVKFADDVMRLGFKYAFQSGISFGKNDIIIPKDKWAKVEATRKEVGQYEKQYADGLITARERYNKVVDSWSNCSEQIAEGMYKIISGTAKDDEINIGQDGLNNLYMMANSGARGSRAQLRQLGGMRGLMAKASGEIIEIPIIANFKEGLSVLQYFISAHGARKGIADVALKTASSGYLTRKLVDVAQDSIITMDDCETTDGLLIKAVIENGEIVVPLSERIVGRVACDDIYSNNPSSHKIVSRNEIITDEIAEQIQEVGIDMIRVRSPLMCKANSGICAHCYGADLATRKLIARGEAIGVIAAQSIGEPGTQLTMRTFHIGGAAQKIITQSAAISGYSGTVKFLHYNTVVNNDGAYIVMSRNCEACIMGDNGNEKAKYKIPYGARLYVQNSDEIYVGQKLADWDPFTTPIITEHSGYARFSDILKGVNMRESYDHSTGITSMTITDHSSKKTKTSKQPKIVLQDADGNIIALSNGLEARYFLPQDTIISIKDGQHVHAGDVLARIPKGTSRTKDITGGLPRVIELFEAREGKDHSIISEIDGYVEFGRDYKSKRRIIVRSSTNRDYFVEYFIPRGAHIRVNEGDHVSKGDLLMDGNPSPHEILRVIGVEALCEYIISEVQQVYRLQGVPINDKHIEVIIRQMLRKYEIVDQGSTTLLIGEQVSIGELNEMNAQAATSGGTPATAVRILQGITRASLHGPSFLAAASFQESAKVLIEAALEGKIDTLQGLKGNKIAGKLIPAGTGFSSRLLERVATLEYEEGKNDIVQDVDVVE